MHYLVTIKTFDEISQILKNHNITFSEERDSDRFYKVIMTRDQKNIIRSEIGLGWNIVPFDGNNKFCWIALERSLYDLHFNSEKEDYTFENAKSDIFYDKVLKWLPIQRWLCWWSRKIWKNSSYLDRSLPNTGHLKDEAQELLDEVEAYYAIPEKLLGHKNTCKCPLCKENNFNNENKPKIKERIKKELADVCQLAYDIASDLGIDLEQAMIDKMEENKNRVWAEPNEQGIIRHVKIEKEEA